MFSQPSEKNCKDAPSSRPSSLLLRFGWLFCLVAVLSLLPSVLGRPAMRGWWSEEPSPHFNERGAGAVIDTIVLHATANSGLEETIRWFQNPVSKVSAHFTIGRDGTIVQHVPMEYKAWHAGQSEMHDGRTGVNEFSIGIELANRNNGTEEYTFEQIDSLRQLVVWIQNQYPVRYLVSHKIIARPPGRKNDPYKFPWEELDGLPIELRY